MAAHSPSRRAASPSRPAAPCCCATAIPSSWQPPPASESPREGIDFFPLTVDVEERMYAAGKIPGGFIKREGRPTEHSILACRLTDRPIRPLFPKGYRNDVQVVITVLSADQENDSDVLGIIGASAALIVSDIPFAGPVGAVRVGYIDGAVRHQPD